MDQLQNVTDCHKTARVVCVSAPVWILVVICSGLCNLQFTSHISLHICIKDALVQAISQRVAHLCAITVFRTRKCSPGHWPSTESPSSSVTFIMSFLNSKIGNLSMLNPAMFTSCLWISGAEFSFPLSYPFLLLPFGLPVFSFHCLSALLAHSPAFFITLLSQYHFS